MRRCFFVLNHIITFAQKEELKNSFSITSYIGLPKTLAKIWVDIDPKTKLQDKGIDDIIGWIKKLGAKGDLVLVQGEFGATFYIVDFCFKEGFIPIYASSKRVYKEKHNSDGTVERNHVFKHEQFRQYIRYL